MDSVQARRLFAYHVYRQSGGQAGRPQDVPVVAEEAGLSADEAREAAYALVNDGILEWRATTALVALTPAGAERIRRQLEASDDDGPGPIGFAT